MAVTVIGRWFWVDDPSLYRFVIEGKRFAAVDPNVIVHPGLGTYPMVKFAGSFPVFFSTTSEDMAVPGSPLAAAEEVSSADHISAMDMETVAVALREIAPENAAQDEVAMNEKLRWPADGYWKSGVGPKLSPTMPYPVSPGRSSKVEAEDEDEVWTVAVQREFSMRLESAGVS